MKVERKLDFEVNNQEQLNKMLTGALMDVRRGEMSYEMAKAITLLADKINKGNVNAIEYKKITNHQKPLKFFDIEG